MKLTAPKKDWLLIQHYWGCWLTLSYFFEGSRVTFSKHATLSGAFLREQSNTYYRNLPRRLRDPQRRAEHTHSHARDQAAIAAAMTKLPLAILEIEDPTASRAALEAYLANV